MRRVATFVTILAGMATARGLELQVLLIRPARPLAGEVSASYCGVVRPSLSEVKDAVAAMQELKRVIRPDHANVRSEIRQELRIERASLRQELNDSIEEAKKLALENLRKINEEMKERGRGRNR